MNRLGVVIALVLFGFAVVGGADDAANDKRLIELQRRAEQAQVGKVGVAQYGPAKALAWLDFALHERYDQDQAGVIEHALAEAERLLTATGPESAFATPIAAGAERIRDDLWSRAAALRGNPYFGCAAREIAQLEVHLVWAGHEKWEQGWTHARPVLEIAERLADAAASAQRVCSATPAPEVDGVAFAGDALFPFNQADVKRISPAARAKLEAFVQELKQWRSIDRIEVVGHADRLGPAQYNLDLSRRRARSVRGYLIGQGLPAGRMAATGKGALAPLVLCKGDLNRKALRACLQPNRRVEITVHGEL